MTIKTPAGKPYKWKPETGAPRTGHEVIVAPTRHAMTEVLLEHVAKAKAMPKEAQ